MHIQHDAETREAGSRPWPGRFGHHEVWHLFVLAGAGAHYAFAYSLVDLPYAPF